MKKLIPLLLILSLLSGCALPGFPEPTEKPAPVELPGFLFDDEPLRESTQPQTGPASVTDLIHLMDYAILAQVLLDAGCEELCWDTPDLDGDGLPEWIAQAYAGSANTISQIIADGSSLAMEAFTPTGISQITGFFCNEQGIPGLFSGYNALGITDGYFYTWNGYRLVELADVPEEVPSTDEFGEYLPTTPETVHSYEGIFLSNPELRTLISPLDPQLTANAFHVDYLNRGLNPTYLTADLDGDGTQEHILLLWGAANKYLTGLSGMSFWGDEKFLNHQDVQASAVVISAFAGQTWIRLARLESESAEDARLTENGLCLGGQSYCYQSTGEPFLVWDGSDSLTVQTELVSLALPERWQNQYLYSYYEHTGEDGIRDRICLVFRERSGYLGFGGGFLFSLVLLSPDAVIDYPQYEILGTLTLGEDCYTVLAEYPSDVQYTEDNQALYTALREDIPAVLATLTPAEDAVFTPAS